jgi:hypothetical protein
MAHGTSGSFTVRFDASFSHTEGQTGFVEVMCAFNLNGTSPFKVLEALDYGLWDHPLLTSCEAASMFNPIGPWATCELSVSGAITWLTFSL